MFAHVTMPDETSDQELPAVCAVIQKRDPGNQPVAAYLGSLRPDLVLWLNSLFLPLLIFEAKRAAESPSTTYGPSKADL